MDREGHSGLLKAGRGIRGFAQMIPECAACGQAACGVWAGCVWRVGRLRAFNQRRTKMRLIPSTTSLRLHCPFFPGRRKGLSLKSPFA